MTDKEGLGHAGGFTGLATAYYVLQRAPTLCMAVFEARQVGAGASGRIGGLVLEDTAVGPLPGLDGCLATLHTLARTQHILCDLRVGGCWEMGGAFDPRKLLAATVKRAGGTFLSGPP